MEIAESARKAAVKRLGPDAETPAGRHTIARIGDGYLTAALQAARTAKAAGKQDFFPAAATPEAISQTVGQCLAMGVAPGGQYPLAYLVPRQGALRLELSHRGLTAIAARQGWLVLPVIVRTGDRYTIRMGELVAHEEAGDGSPMAGVAVVCRRTDTGLTVAVPWVSAATIDRRRPEHEGAPWKGWSEEMAAKTAIKWVFARGIVPVDVPSADEDDGPVAPTEPASPLAAALPPDGPLDLPPVPAPAAPAPAPARTRRPPGDMP